MDAVEKWYSIALLDSSIEWTQFLFSRCIAPPEGTTNGFLKEPRTSKTIHFDLNLQ